MTVGAAVGAGLVGWVAWPKLSAILKPRRCAACRGMGYNLCATCNGRGKTGSPSLAKALYRNGSEGGAAAGAHDVDGGGVAAVCGVDAVEGDAESAPPRPAAVAGDPAATAASPAAADDDVMMNLLLLRLSYCKPCGGRGRVKCEAGTSALDRPSTFTKPPLRGHSRQLL